MAIRLQVDTIDLTALDSFPLGWRWIDPSYTVLPASVVATIRPLTPAKAQEIWDITEPYWRALFPSPVGTDPKNVFEATAAVRAAGDVSSVREWLRALLPRRDLSVVVSWDNRCAILTTWSVFCTCWDNFCYPSSDDVTILPLSGKWLLCYHHEAWFIFGRLRGMEQ